MWGAYPDAVLPGLGVVEGGQTSTGSAVAWFRRLVSGGEWTHSVAAGRVCAARRSLSRRPPSPRTSLRHPVSSPFDSVLAPATVLVCRVGVLYVLWVCCACLGCLGSSPFVLGCAGVLCVLLCFVCLLLFCVFVFCCLTS